MAGRWENAGVVRGFSTAAANEILLAFVRAELARRPRLPLAEYNRPPAGREFARGGPVIYEGTFRMVGAGS